MFRQMSVCAVLVAMVFCGAVVGAASAQEKVDNPQYTSWAKHKPGTSVTMKMTTSMGPQSMNMEIRQTLKDVSPDKLTLEVQTSMMQGDQKQALPASTISIDAKVSPEEAKFGPMPQGAKADVKELGTETVSVAGKSYRCKVSEVTGEAEGMTTKGKVWRSEDVPGEMVKMEMTVEGAQEGSTAMELVSVEQK